MIIVIDTNVWISALVFSAGRGTVYQAFEQATAIDTLASCQELESEITSVLRERFLWPNFRIDHAISAIFANAVRVSIQRSVRVCRDPNDDIVLECAERSQADFIMTGDKDLLDLGSYRKTRIITPKEFLEIGQR